MQLIDLLTPARVRTGVRISSKKRLLEMLAGLLRPTEGDAELERRIYDSLCARERLGSTGLGDGVAIPHGRLEGLSAPSGAFLRLAEPLPFEASDARAVDLVFALVVPEQFTEQHLLLLSRLADMFSDQAFCARLRSAADDTALHAALEDWQLSHLVA